jgi:hypothetical protein
LKGGIGLDYWWLEDDRTGQHRDEFLISLAAGVSHHFTPCITGYANASFGARHPSLFETFDLSVIDGSWSSPTPISTTDPPRRARSASRRPSGTTTFQADVFAHYIKDFIGRETVGVDQIWDNVGSVTLYGAEAGLLAPEPVPCRASSSSAAPPHHRHLRRRRRADVPFNARRRGSQGLRPRLRRPPLVRRGRRGRGSGGSAPATTTRS